MKTFFLFICCLWCHIIDDYFLQGCLANLKQKSWWQHQLKHHRELDRQQYKYDYIMALAMHAMSWSFSIMIPLIIVTPTMYLFFCWMFFANAIIHAFVDDDKANRHKINLVEDQIVHVMQIVMVVVLWHMQQPMAK